ncbi:MAG TPA: sugar-transfer associated ATP-grasp domain-containing protein [bacterium]|nr:sugar-transfer associated ATP-grasp domain-containing protein [bacterium]
MAFDARAESTTRTPTLQTPRNGDLPSKARKLPYLPGRGLRWLARFLEVARCYMKEIRACIGHFPLEVVLFGLRRGFAADRVLLYGRDAVQSGRYLSDLQRQFSRFINPKPVRELLEDKLLFESLAKQFVRVPRNYLYCDNKRLVVLTDEWPEIALSDNSSQQKRFVMKRSRGGGGVGISFVDVKPESVLVDDTPMTLDRFYEVFKERDDRILCEFIQQSDFCALIYPHTTNSIRVICMRDRDGEPFIARAVLRLGTTQSKGVDNFGRGGLSVDIDLETGKLGTAVQHNAKSPRAPLVYENHPDTGAPLRGQSLPRWGEARDRSLLLMRQLPFINYVGWDIILTEQDPVFLEGNNYTGVRLAQAHSGLLDEPRICDFYRRFGII